MWLPPSRRLPLSPAPPRRANTSSPGCAQTNAHIHTHVTPILTIRVLPPVHTRTHTQKHTTVLHLRTRIIRKHADVSHQGHAD